MSFLVALNILALATIGVLIAHWHIQQRALRAIMAAKVGAVSDPVITVKWFAGWIHAQVPRRQDPLFVSPLFHVFGASPIAVLDSGGCCSGLARLYILGLDSLGVRASQITLYHVSGCAQHCAVEVSVGGDRMIVDPRYGLYYTDGIGAPIGLEGLQTGRIPTLHSLPLSSATAYPPSHYYDFDYQITKTANWTRSAPRRAAYRVLRALSAGRIDRCRLPAILEWPQILLSSALTGILGLTDLLFLLT